MNKLTATICVFGALSAAAAADLSKYRGFQFGMDLPTVAKQAGMNASEAKVIHSRPALMQELVWRPKPLGLSSQTEPAEEVAFSFYNGELYRIAVSYDRHEIEGMTADDLVEAISAQYGVSTKPSVAVRIAPPSYGDHGEVVAEWQDSEYHFDLTRSSYGPSFSLVGATKKLEAPVQAATIESARLDDKEAPQREAERLARDSDAEQARLEKARLVNKPKFRP